MTLFPVLVDAYHEQLLTREEAVKIAADVWDYAILWVQNVAVTKDGDTAARIADILDKHGMVDVARHIRGKCVYRRLKCCTGSL